MKYSNPIIRGFYPDPSICRVGEEYYLVNSSFEYLPGIPVFQSKNLVNWEQIGHCITRSSQININNAPPSAGIFAPTIRYSNGNYYVVTTNILEIDKGNFFVKASNPCGPWSEPIWVDIHGIDPSFYFEGNDSYIQYTTRINGRSGIMQAKINIETGELLGESELITYGSGGRHVEGPHMYKVNGYYYLLTAEGGTELGHMVTIRRSKSIWGPFEECPRNPILTNRNNSEQLLQNVGHADLFQDHKGSWWIVALAVRAINSRDYLGRETILLPVKWDEEGWPIVHKGYAEVLIDAQLPEEISEDIIDFYDDFNSEEMDLRWNTIRNFSKEYFSLSDKKGYLTLYTNKNSLDQLEEISFIGCRQRDFNCEFITKLKFQGVSEKEEAGITIFMDNLHHMELYISGIDVERTVNVRKTVADVMAVKSVDIREVEAIYLKIIGNESEYMFYYSLDGQEYIFIDKTYTKHISIQSAFTDFTGVYIGMYSTSNGKETNAKAYYDFVSCKYLNSNK